MASSSKKSIPEKKKKKETTQETKPTKSPKKKSINISTTKTSHHEVKNTISNGATTQETKPTKSPKKKSNNISTTKTSHHEVKNTISNGAVSDSDNEVIVIRSSSTESQEEEQKHRSAVSSKRTNGTKSNKGKQKQQQQEEDDVKLHRFPMNRIKTIIRSGDSDFGVNQEAIFLVNKATEKFIEKFTEDGHACCVKDRKKSLSYNHLSSAVCKRRRYEFLSDFVPEKLQAKDALAERQKTETGAG